MSAQPLTRVTPEQYLEADRASEFRSEYYDGVMYAMSGSSFAHNMIAGSFHDELDRALEGRNCFVPVLEVRLRVPPGTVYTFPDLMVVCGQPIFADDQRDTLLNPSVVIEVLSPSTEAYDRGFKFAQYRRIESLKEYVLVSQIEPRVEKFTRQADGTWLFSEYVGLTSVCRFDSIGCEIALAKIYKKIPLRENGG